MALFFYRRRFYSGKMKTEAGTRKGRFLLYLYETGCQMAA